MLTYYQPFLLPYIHQRKTLPKPKVHRKAFLSFEDGLWNLLSSAHIPNRSVIMLPDFYCMDVVENIRTHGYDPVFYPLDANFQIAQPAFERIRKKWHPSVIMLFHACGIRNTISENDPYLEHLTKHSLVIEDYVQRLIKPDEISIKNRNHIVMDSLRKVSPLNGSFMYGTKERMTSLARATKTELQYRIITEWLYLLFRLVFSVGTLLRSNAIIRFSHFTLLKKHDDIIGDSREGHTGSFLTRIIHPHLNFQKIHNIKRQQITQYRHGFSWIRKSNAEFYLPHIPKQDEPHMHVFPLGIRSRSSGERMNRFLETYGIPVWTKFPDCPWSRNKHVLFLPLGAHVRYNEIDRIVTLIRSTYETDIK